MKHWLCILTMLAAVQITLGQASRDFLPPYNFQVDSTTLLATWEAPKIVLLNEDFEGDVFPPPGWADTSLGLGWLCEDDPQYNWWWVVPEHSGKQAQVNDDIVPANDGSMDFLFLPALDLTVADSFMLVFNSYFDGAYGQTAFVKYSVDDGVTWQVLEKMDADLEWQKAELDLSPFSGATGVSNFKLAFYTNDKADNGGWWASGWAIDNVFIWSGDNPEQVLSYRLFLDSVIINQVTGHIYQYYFEYSTTHSCGILAHYQNGNSDTVWQTVQSACLLKPDSLSGIAPDDAVILTWSPPLVPGPWTGSNRDFGDIIYSFPSPSPIGLCFGICDDGEGLWVSYGEYLYACLVDVEEPLAVPCGGSSIPENLIGFNIYKNGAYLDSIHCAEPECCYYIDPIELTDEVINYEVTALYDLTTYGYPADTGESLREGPVEIYSCCFNEMDFFENWSYGWEENYWKSAGDNWKIVQDTGNEAPAVVFSPDTALINYQDSLQSLIILEFAPLEIILSYDISLTAVSSTGNEKLLVQIFDLYCSCWNTIKIYDNAEGSFEWISDTLNITGYFNSEAFRIRFKVQGENSDDINYWAVDNISARHICLPPENVQATLSAPPADSVIITWDEPIPDISEWKQWDDGIHDGGIGFGTSKSSWFGAAAHWTPEMLVPFKGATITAIGFIPGDLSACFKVAIWSGENKTPVYMQASGNLIMNEWNIITLDYPYPIDITKDLYIGYKLSAYTGYPMSVDDGPAINGFGNSFQNGPDAEWQTILDFNPDIDVNWNIKAYFERDGVPVETFQLFRSINGNEPELLAEVDGNEYADTTLPGYYSACYKLKSSFFNGCISEFSEDTCVVITGINPDNPGDFFELKIYPNPASDVLFIESSERMQSISFYDSQGDKVIRWYGDKGKVEVQVDGLAPGIYMVRVETSGEVLNRKIIVIK